MMPNILQYPIAIFGALKAGLTIVNVNPLYTATELKHQLNDSGAVGILVIENFAHVLEEVLSETKVVHVLTTQIGDRLGFPKKHLINTLVKKVKKMVPPFSLPNAIQFNKALRVGSGLTFNPVSVESDDLAFLQYTGGTTGVAKGAMLSHRNIVANMAQMKGMLEPYLEESKEMVVTALPLYHIYALTCNCLSFMVSGGTNILISNPRDYALFAKALSQYPVTMFSGINTLFAGLLNEPKFKEINFDSWKFSFSGGMATQSSVAERWQAVTGTVIREGYGLTECSPCVTVVPFSKIGFSGSIGVPICNTEVKVTDEQGRELGIEETGELWVKGPQVMLGYYNRQEATDEILKDGWLATGDIARIDEEGFVYIVDRKKDMILVSGFNVYPNEIEDVVAKLDDIAEVAAIGVPCEKTGEKVKLFVATHSKTLDKDAILAHCRDHLTSYKLPKEFELRDELPKSNVGKILRKELR